MSNNNDKIIMECSFCGRSQMDTKNMITSPDGSSFICEDCVSICSDMLSKTKRSVTQNKIDYIQVDKIIPKTYIQLS